MSKASLIAIGCIVCTFGFLMKASGQVCTCLSLAGLTFFIGDMIHASRSLSSNTFSKVLKYVGCFIYIISAAIGILALFPESEIFRMCYDIFGNVADFCRIDQASIDSKIPIISLGCTMIYIAIRIMIAERSAVITR
ncbi:hypothetical protein MKY42_22620 [Paenibacillus sp. FSL W7-1088]|uniref:hypothetical protein n=1 Tax=unclassified Paenibacillus TaxID=185978 RepID=UPI0015C5A645|nr:hypothetical protein [Paenibacillus sp. E222]QLG39440.1 hypothetical protein HW560_15955 [Paenibacillus sp. E222]